MTETRAKYGGTNVLRYGQDAEPYDLPIPDTSHVLSFTVDVPPTLNNAYPTNPKTGRRFPSKAATKFKKDAGWIAKQAAVAADWEAGLLRLGMALLIVFPETVRRRDISNRIKLCEDAIAEALGFDDERVDMIVVRRGDSGEPRCEVKIWFL